MKLPGVISLRKALPICAMPNGSFLRETAWIAGKFDEHALGGLRPQIRDRVVLLDRSEERLQHQVELLRFGELRAPTVRAEHHAVGVGLEVVLPEALVAVRALHERVVERLEVPARLPHAWARDDGGLDAHDVVAQLHVGTPPGVADVAAQLDPERAVVPRGAQAAVDLGRLERDAPALREAGDGLHEVGHDAGLLSRPLAATAGVGPIVPAPGRRTGVATEPSRLGQ